MDCLNQMKKEVSLEETPENSSEEEGYVSSSEVTTITKMLAKGRTIKVINNNQGKILMMRKMMMIAISDPMSKYLDTLL